MDQSDREQDLRTRTYSEQTFDKQLVYLAGGGLVLTMGFIKEVIDLDTAKWIALLFSTWILFTLALTSNLVSHKASTEAVDYRLTGDIPNADKWNNRIKWINRFSIGTLLGGLLSFIFFIIINISHV